MPVQVQIGVPREAVDGFAQVWRYKGVSIALDDAHKQFAYDFAMTVLSQALQQFNAVQQQMNQAQATQPAEAAPEKPSLIVEG
jgi:hypothetical protein